MVKSSNDEPQEIFGTINRQLMLMIQSVTDKIMGRLNKIKR